MVTYVLPNWQPLAARLTLECCGQTYGQTDIASEGPGGPTRRQLSLSREYHVVFVPKGWKKASYGKIRKFLGPVLHECAYRITTVDWCAG